MRSFYMIALCWLPLAACTRNNLAAGVCSDYKDAASCSANVLCEVEACPDCSGGSSFSGCVAKGEGAHLCPGTFCAAPCSSFTTREDCEANPICEAAGCVGCGPQFSGCYAKGTAPAVVCPGSCPACSVYTDESSCAAASYCHPVYVDLHAGACAGAGCCTTFDHCGAGAAMCTPGPLGPTCAQPTPLCEGDFVVGYFDGCPEGCVRSDECS